MHPRLETVDAASPSCRVVCGGCGMTTPANWFSVCWSMSIRPSRRAGCPMA